MRFIIILLFIMISFNSCIMEKFGSKEYEIQELEIQACETTNNKLNSFIKINLKAIYYSPIVISELFFIIKNNGDSVIFFDSTSIAYDSNIYDYDVSFLDPKSMRISNGEEKSLLISLRVLKNEREVENALKEKLYIKLYGYLEGNNKKLLYCGKLSR